ncbi:enoyl-CoA hydratase/isomerase family protein [Pseudoruegeria sp. SHC-113]|uniref:enoyl-CoA hydratase/isomerase family protein n=1 Tax=Pseudoruegeria sp. SHC-113 TaxID=2855439 RepID=UPI0021BA57ED|nr:enoyl-CoA hydratase/isomerase family protein [Pseudoruegeria sp. SHC-113]MCT8162073.1 enoyl-CoA hydratase/isomerase family protein [Pseudoruegeria sp. SHC-113]
MSCVTLTHTGPVAVLTLENAPKLNALTTGMLQELSAHLDALDRAPDVRAVILTGAGPKAFCCGADISEWGQLSPAEFARSWVRDGHRIFDRLARLSKPTIGALNGHAFGGGLELAACCDIRVITPRATLALPEGKVGIVPGWSGSQRLLRLLPESVVKDIALFGRRIPAERALRFGFVAEIAEDSLAAAQAIAAELAAVSPRANEITKAMIHAAVGEDRAAAIEALGGAAAGASADRDEGVAAFLSKRSPDFSGQ